MIVLSLGIVILCGFPVMDVFMRLRMRRAGYKGAFVRGGYLSHAEYLRQRSKYGWSAWPVYLMWAMLAVGLTLVILGVAKFGANP
jgi:hypothetical protein